MATQRVDAFVDEVFDAKGSIVTLSVIPATDGAPNHLLVTSTTGCSATLAARGEIDWTDVG